VPCYVTLGKRMDTRWLMMFGLACFALSMWSFSFITHDWGGDQLWLPQVLRGFPQVFAVAPAVTLGLGALAPERLKYASGLFNMMRNLGGAVGIAICGAVLNDRTNSHFLDIASTLTPANEALRRFMSVSTSQLAPLLGSMQAAHAASLKLLWNLAYREASTMAYADAFRTVGIICLVATFLVPMLKKVAQAPAPSAGAH
jgi:MFS transporter, DHA2 family, multidrug resistance protein